MAHPDAQDFGPLLEWLQSLEGKRKQLQDRLRAIEERKGATAPQIYEKVRAETRDKLAEVESESSARLPELRHALDVVSEQRSALNTELGELREKLEEVRFRNSLGEFGPEEFLGLEKQAASALTRAEERARPLEELARFLASFTGAPAAPTGSAYSTNPGDPPRSDFTRPAAAPPIPKPPQAAAPPARSAPPPPAPPAPAVSEMEALFGSGPPPSPMRAEPGKVSRQQATLPPEETTQDLGIRQGESPGFPGPQSSVFHPVLIVKTRDKDRGEDSYELAPGQTLIGRAPENDIILLEESVSRRHARLTVENGHCSIEDLGSANGSFLNGERLKPKLARTLQDNDVVKLGQLLALYRQSPDD